MPEQWSAMLAEYRFTRNDGHPLTAAQQREMDDSMFELIGAWAQERGLAVEGQALFERLTPEASVPAEIQHFALEPGQAVTLPIGVLRMISMSEEDGAGAFEFTNSTAPAVSEAQTQIRQDDARFEALMEHHKAVSERLEVVLVERERMRGTLEFIQDQAGQFRDDMVGNPNAYVTRLAARAALALAALTPPAPAEASPRAAKALLELVRQADAHYTAAYQSAPVGLVLERKAAMRAISDLRDEMESCFQAYEATP